MWGWAASGKAWIGVVKGMHGLSKQERASLSVLEGAAQCHASVQVNMRGVQNPTA